MLCWNEGRKSDVEASGSLVRPYDWLPDSVGGVRADAMIALAQ